MFWKFKDFVAAIGLTSPKSLDLPRGIKPESINVIILHSDEYILKLAKYPNISKEIKIHTEKDNDKLRKALMRFDKTYNQ